MKSHDDALHSWQLLFDDFFFFSSECNIIYSKFTHLIISLWLAIMYLLTTFASFIGNQITIMHQFKLKLLTRWHSMFFQHFCVMEKQFHTLVCFGISMPSFDIGAQMKYFCGPQLNQSGKDFGWTETYLYMGLQFVKPTL